MTIDFQQAVADVRATRIEIEGRWNQQSKALLVKMRRPVTCRKGCAHCCYHPVLISVFEGLLLFRNLKANRLWTSTLRKQLQESSNKTIGLDYRVWLMSALPCPLLRDNECIAYEARPLRCRLMSSIDDPVRCHPHSFSGTVEILPFAPVLRTFQSLERQLMHHLSMPYIHLPLGQAVLMGAKIDQGDMRLAELMGTLLKQYTEVYLVDDV
jgi:Fe-S-cluster containining protein